MRCGRGAAGRYRFPTVCFTPYKDGVPILFDIVVACWLVKSILLNMPGYLPLEEE